MTEGYWDDAAGATDGQWREFYRTLLLARRRGHGSLEAARRAAAIAEEVVLGGHADMDRWGPRMRAAQEIAEELEGSPS